MAYNGQQIKVVEGNAFAMLFPLKARTYTLNGAPMDTDIDLEYLTNIVVKIGSTSYEYTKEAGGLQIMEDGSLAKGTYDIVITGEYWGDKVRAAYYQALVVVAWNNQSDAEQYIAGSPIVCNAAYLIAGVLTDAELEALKAELRQDIADAEQAKADYEQAKADYDAKAEALDDVAQETTSQEILNAVGNIDFSELAKQGTNPNATNTAILAAFDNIDFSQVAKQGGNANISLTTMDAKLGDYVLIQDEEYAPALADLATNFV